MNEQVPIPRRSLRPYVEELEHKNEDLHEAVRLALAALNNPSYWAATKIREAKKILEGVVNDA